MLVQLTKRHQNRYAVFITNHVSIKLWVYDIPEVTEMQQRLQCMSNKHTYEDSIPITSKNAQ
jgi:hypothetical protein